MTEANSSRFADRSAYEDRCREEVAAQGLGPITERLTAEAIRYDVEQAGGFVMVVRIPLSEPAWIGVTASDKQPGAWCIVPYDDTDEGTPLPTAGSYHLAADEAVPAIQERIALTGREPDRAVRRLVNATVLYCYPNGSGGTYTVLGPGSWGRPEEALEYAQERRDAFYRRHGATPFTEVPWHCDASQSGLPLYRAPGVAVGVEIHDVRTHERWLVPTVGAPLGPIGPRDTAAGTPRWHASPPAPQRDVTAAHRPPQADPPEQQAARHLLERLDSPGGNRSPDLCL